MTPATSLLTGSGIPFGGTMLWPDLDNPYAPPGQDRAELADAAQAESLSSPGAIPGFIPAAVSLRQSDAAVSAWDDSGQSVRESSEQSALRFPSFSRWPAVVPEPNEPFSLAVELKYALEVFLAAYLPTTALRFVILTLIQVFTGEMPDSHPFLEMLEDGLDITLVSLIVVMAVVMAPIIEELFYRVVILGGLAQLGRAWPGLILSSIIFCFAHGFPDSLALLPLAFALGYTYLRRRSYITVMLVHFLFNGFNIIIAGLAMV